MKTMFNFLGPFQAQPWICTKSLNMNCMIHISKKMIIPLKTLQDNKIFGELSFGGRWTPKLTKGPYNSSN